MEDVPVSDGKLWWGYSCQHGWVVLDRNIAVNRPGVSGNLVFLKCTDWTRFEELRTQWDVSYVFENQYLARLPASALPAAQSELKNLKELFMHKKVEMYSAAIMVLHSQFLSRNGCSEKSAIIPFHGKNKRSANCWSCKKSVDNSVDLECSGCGWIICGSCGACGCAYCR